MKREHWKELLPTITAFANGERVEWFDGEEYCGSGDMITFSDKPSNYRIAPRTIRIGNYDVPEPYRWEMEEGQRYYVPEVHNKKFRSECQWGGDESDKTWMARGLIHLTPEAAAIHGKALASLTAGEGVEL